MKKALLMAAVLVACAQSGYASFIVDPSPGGEKLNLDDGNNVSSFTGHVNTDVINITTKELVDPANGNATIKPINRGLLTEITFTPADGDLFSSFSFRGMLNNAANDTVTLTVQDNQGNAPQIFVFSGLGNGDFSRIGIYSLDGETIKSVTLVSDFKQQKQTEFGYAVAVGAPDGGATLLMLGLGAACLGIVKRRS